MTADHLAILHKFAAGAIDAYDVHRLRPAVAAALDALQQPDRPSHEHMADVLARTVRPFHEALADQHDAA